MRAFGLTLILLAFHATIGNVGWRIADAISGKSVEITAGDSIRTLSMMFAITIGANLVMPSRDEEGTA